MVPVCSFISANFVYLGKTFLYNTIIKWLLAGKPNEQNNQDNREVIYKIEYLIYIYLVAPGLGDISC